MTLTQLAATSYERMLARATAEGVKVTGLDTHVIDGATVHYFTVYSPTSGKLYCLSNRFAGQVLACDCPAGEAGTYCKHRAACTAHLIEAARKAAQAVTEAMSELYGAFDNLTSVEHDGDLDAWMDDQEGRYLSEMDHFIAEMAC